MILIGKLKERKVDYICVGMRLSNLSEKDDMKKVFKVGMHQEKKKD